MASRRRPERSIEHNILLTATLCLLAGGAVMVFSASSARELLSGTGLGADLLVRYIVFAAIGIGAMLIVARRSLDQVLAITGPLLLVAFLLTAAVRLPGVGIEVGGAKRWLGAGPLTFQPSELLKLALVLYAARLLAERPQTVRDWYSLRPFLLVGGGGVGLVALQPDLGTALVCAFALAAMLIAAGLPLRILGWLAGGGGVLLVLYAVSAPYRMERLTAFVDPWKHASDAGYQITQGLIGFGSGGLFGLGLGESVQKNMFLPEAHTDFILAVIGEEVGTIGVLALLFLYGLFAYAGLMIAKRANGRYPQLLAAGITSLYLSQAMLNIFAVLGLAPLTGVPLPFISYGGTTLVTMLIGIGLVLNVAAGGQVRLRVVSDRDDARDSGSDERTYDNRDRRRRHSRSRSADAGRRRRVAG